MQAIEAYFVRTYGAPVGDIGRVLVAYDRPAVMPPRNKWFTNEVIHNEFV